MMSEGEPLELNELPDWSPWPARLLGLAPWTAPVRNIEKVEAEWDADKYARCLDFFRSDPSVSFEDVKQFEVSVANPTEKVCVSRAGLLRVMSFAQAWSAWCEMVQRVMDEFLGPAATVVELGAGYGYNGWRIVSRHPGMSYRAGEHSRNAVELASLLFDRHEMSSCSVLPFNFYEAESYDGVMDVPAPAVVITMAAVEQLAKAGVVPDNLRRYRDRIDVVIHLEPIYELHDDSLLGLLRRRYTEQNDYNRDLLSVLEGSADVHLMRTEYDLFGWPPLNPTSLIVWRFAP